MPAVKIELRTGRDKQTLIKIKNLVMAAVVESLQLPSHDTNIRLAEYQPEFFQLKSPYEILVEVSMFEGRTKETKKKMYQSIVEKLESNGIIEKKKVLIIVHEQKLQDWGIRGGIPADEVDLGFKVNV